MNSRPTIEISNDYKAKAECIKKLILFAREQSVPELKISIEETEDKEKKTYDFMSIFEDLMNAGELDRAYLRSKLVKRLNHTGHFSINAVSKTDAVLNITTAVATGAIAFTPFAIPAALAFGTWSYFNGSKNQKEHQIESTNRSDALLTYLDRAFPNDRIAVPPISLELPAPSWTAKIFKSKTEINKAALLVDEANTNLYDTDFSPT